MNRQLDPTIERLRETMQTVADQVLDAPPPFVPVLTTPLASPRRNRTMVVAAACVVALALGAITVVLTRDSSDGHTPVIQQPSVPSTVPLPSAVSALSAAPGDRIWLPSSGG